MKIPPAPLQTPISGDHETFGVPYQNRPDTPPAAGTLNITWAAWFNNHVRKALLRVPEIFASLAVLPTNLSKEDINYLAWDSGLQHMYLWTGSAWIFGPGDDHMAGKIVAIANGAVIDGSIWKVCDGTAYNVSKGDGTTVNVTTPILNTGSFLVGAAAQTAVIAATNPQFAGGAKTDDEAAHTHAIGISTGNIGAGAAQYDSVTPTGAGSAHHHTLSNANAPINAGLPQNISLVWYLRL